MNKDKVFDEVIKSNVGLLTCIESGKKCLSKRDAGNLVNRFKHHHNCCKKYPRQAYFCVSCGTYHVTSLKYFVA